LRGVVESGSLLAHVPNPFRLLALAAVAAATLAGCSDMGTPLKLQAQAELSPTSIDFGTVAVSGSATRSVTVGNSGTADLTGNATLVACTEYQLVSGGGPFTIGPGQQLKVVLRFKPSTVGPFPCTLDLGPNCGQVTLAGMGALQNPGAHATVTPGTLDFGFLPIGQPPSLRIFQIFSDGTAPLLVDVVPSCATYTVFSGGGPASLATGTSLTVTVGFTPLAGGTAACAIAIGPGIPDVSVTGDGTTVSYSGDLQTIFLNESCLSCHGYADPNLSGILYLYGSFVNRTSLSYSPALIVKPYDPVNSVLYGKVTNSGQFGPLMPQGGSLIPQAERDKIRTWILEGAHNN